MEIITKQQFFEQYEYVADVVKLMTDYRNQFNERLTAHTYHHYIDNTIMEDEDEGES
jgi:hypothetical protein